MHNAQNIRAALERQQRNTDVAVARSKFTVIEGGQGRAPVQDHTPNLKNLIDDQTTARRTRGVKREV